MTAGVDLTNTTVLRGLLRKDDRKAEGIENIEEGDYKDYSDITSSWENEPGGRGIRQIG